MDETRRNVEDAEELGYLVTDVNCEYMVLIDEHSEDEKEYVLYLGHANSTMWVERILMVD